MRVAAALLISFVACGACGGTTTNAGTPPSTSSPAPTHAERTEPIKVGDRMTPIAGPIAIPVKGAKLTMVSYFATWCDSSKRWLPHVEEMRKKHAGALAVIGVSNYDEATQTQLEDFVKQFGGSFPVSADSDHQILNALPPSGWGQAIVVVDAKGIVRVVHRGTREGDFERMDEEITRLLAKE